MVPRAYVLNWVPSPYAIHRTISFGSILRYNVYLFVKLFTDTNGSLRDRAGVAYIQTNDAIRPAKNIRILEIALCITDKNYVKLDGGISYLVHWPMTAEEVAADMPSVYVIPALSYRSQFNQ